jgi:hypothetical protein
MVEGVVVKGFEEVVMELEPSYVLIDWVVEVKGFEVEIVMELSYVLIGWVVEVKGFEVEIELELKLG